MLSVWQFQAQVFLFCPLIIEKTNDTQKTDRRPTAPETWNSRTTQRPLECNVVRLLSKSSWAVGQKVPNYPIEESFCQMFTTWGTRHPEPFGRVSENQLHWNPLSIPENTKNICHYQ